MAGNFPNLVTEKGTQVQSGKSMPIMMNPKRPTLRHIIIKMEKLEDREI